MYIYVGFSLWLGLGACNESSFGHFCYAIEKIFTSANMIITELDK